MCLDIWIDGDRLECLGDLRKRIGREPVIAPGYGDLEDEICLCPVDLDATAALIGRVVDCDDDGEIVFARP